MRKFSEDTCAGRCPWTVSSKCTLGENQSLGSLPSQGSAETLVPHQLAEEADHFHDLAAIIHFGDVEDRISQSPQMPAQAGIQGALLPGGVLAEAQRHGPRLSLGSSALTQ